MLRSIISSPLDALHFKIESLDLALDLTVEFLKTRVFSTGQDFKLSVKLNLGDYVTFSKSNCRLYASISG
jgi:hypothetical protein